MAFIKVNPAQKVKTGQFKFSTVCRQGGPFKYQIVIPSPEFTLHFGAAENVDVFFGDGPDKGKLLIAPTKEGGFKAKGLKHCFMLLLPEMEGTPQAKFEGLDPERKMTPDGLLVTLPVWVERWRDIVKARETARAQNNAEAKQSRGEIMSRVGQIKG